MPGIATVVIAEQAQILLNVHRFVLFFVLGLGGCGYMRNCHVEWYLAARFTQSTVNALGPHALLW